MSKPWRNLAIVLFVSSLVFAGVAGDKLLALSDESKAELTAYTELLTVAHRHHGAEVLYRDLVYASIQGMLRTLDPHTSFLSPEAYENMRQRQQGSFYGLGILVSMRNGQLTVISPIEGTPAWRLGIRAGDVISTIEGEPTDKMSLDEAVTKLKGPKDTQVNVQIVRRGLSKPLPLAITRAEIPQNTVRYAYMMAPGTGYIRLTDFSRSTAREMDEALDKLKAEGMERLILDLRGNGGGLLDQTVTVSGYFLPERSRIVETRGRAANSRQDFHADGRREPLDVPLVVLVNRGTASAAEILAGAIQDHDVGLVVGTPTWGKGLVQTVYNLSYGSGIALTTAKYYTPSGRLIQRDYSSYYDYYNEFEDGDEDGDEGGGEDGGEAGDGSEAAEGVEILVPAEGGAGGGEFATDLGRKVYGGGGITPDVIVELPDGPLILQSLFVHNAFFNFAVDYNNRHPVPDESWQPEEGILEEFREWLISEEIASAEELDELFADPEAATYTRRQIHADLFTAAFGPEASHRVLARGDLQIRKALELLDQARDLLAERRELSGSEESGRFSSPFEERMLEQHRVVQPKDDGRPD
jgi:carboxyl-terminal processing protease